MRNLWSMDGEAIILKEVYSPEVLCDLKEALIDVAKIAKSDTGNHQASDRAPTFGDCKKGMDTVTKNSSIDYSCPSLNGAVRKVIADLILGQIFQPLAKSLRRTQAR